MKNVLVIGDVMLDHYLIGDCSRISPEAPVPIVSIKKEEWRLGGAANVANNLAALQTNCKLLGICGKDDDASQFDFLLTENAFIENRLYKSAYRPTIVKSRVLVGGHQMIRLDKESTVYLNEEEERSLLDSFLKEVESTDIILLSDYSKGVLSEKVLTAIFQIANGLDITTIVDPKSHDFSRYKGATFIKPNRKEAEQATGIKISDLGSLEEASRVIQKITGVEGVIVTLSEDGVGLYMDESLNVIPTKAQKVFDVTGAGDTYLAALACEYLNSENLFSACEFANFAAAVVVAKVGSSTATVEEIEKLIAESVTYES